MIEIFFQPSNLIPTILFLVIVAFWLTVVIGALDLDIFDFDLDIDTDVDTDAEVDSSNVFGLNKILTFFNLGKIPFMVFLTFLIIPWWFGTILLNNILGINNFFFGLLTLIALLIPSLFIAKILTTPFVKIFAALDKGNIQRDILGTIGTVRYTSSPEKTGQGEFQLDDAFLTLNIRTKKGTVNRGDSVMIISDKNKDEYYLVEQQIII